MRRKYRFCAPFTSIGALVLLLAATGSAHALSEKALVHALRAGGYKIYFRHAATDWSSDDRVREAGDWTSCDPGEMRQLSGTGRASARRIGRAMRELGIPVRKVVSSEYCRSAETARLLGFGPVETTRDIMNMRVAEYVGGDEAVIRRAQRVLAEPAPPGSNIVIVGHGNLMRAATDAYAAEGGSGIYVPEPDSVRGFELVARLAPKDWERLAARFPGDS